jgi:DNA invertase Pin-like site-specific DNA recombinase
MGQSKQLGYAVAYYRVSTAEQGLSGLGLAAQEGTVKAFAAARGWRIVAAFTDIASGKSDARPGYQAALAECRKMGAFLIAARLDRITRRAHSLSALLEEGIRPRTADMPDADDLMLRVYAAMAQRERELISERTKVALAAAKARREAAGLPGLGGDRGYRPAAPPDAQLAAEARVRLADQAAYRVLPLIDELHQAGARSLHQLAAGLTERGVPTPRGGAWTATAVRRALLRAGNPLEAAVAQEAA